MKKLLALLLAALTAVSLLPAAASAQDLEHMDLTVSLWDIENSFPEGKEKDAILRTVEEKFNVTFIPMNIGWDGYQEKMNVWAASSSLPDITGGIDWVGSGTYQAWVEDGVVRALPEDLSAYPNIAKYIELPEVKAYQKDGRNYFLPRMTYMDPTYWAMDRGMLIRKDWLEALGLAMPKTPEELKAVLEAFKTGNPSGDNSVGLIPMSSNGVTFTGMNLPAFGYTDNRWVKQGEEWKMACYEASAIPLIDYYRTLFKEGLYDQDFASRAVNDAQQLFANGRVDVLLKQVSPSHVKKVYDLWVVAQPDKSFFDSVAIVPLEGENCYQFQEMSYWSETYIPSTVSDEKMARILSIMDYLYSEEGMKFVSFGFEGEDYHYDDNGNIVLTLPVNEQGKMLQVKDKYPGAEFLADLAQWNGDLLQYINPNIPQEIRDMCQAEYDRRSTTWKHPALDWEIAALDLPEKVDMTARTQDWASVVGDTSDRTTEELYQEKLALWNSQGYEACWKAVTEAAKKLGK